MRTHILLAAALLGGCGPSRQAAEPPPGVSLTVEPTAVRAGASVTLTLRNGTAGPVGYNLCTSGLERGDGGGWAEVPADRVCTMELRSLQPGGEDSFPLELPDTLPPGEYRFHTTVEEMDGGARDVVRTDPFRVAS